MSLAFVLFARRHPRDIGLIACVNLTVVCVGLDLTLALSLL